MFPNSSSVTLHLLAIVNRSDALGIRCPTVMHSSLVYGSIKSITNSEYQTSLLKGVTAELKVVIQSFLYGGEKFVRIGEVIYEVTRTYINGQFIELYLSQSQYKDGELIYESNSG